MQCTTLHYTTLPGIEQLTGHKQEWMFVVVQSALRNPKSPTRRSKLELWVENVSQVVHFFLCLSDDGLLRNWLEGRVFCNPHHFHGRSVPRLRVQLYRQVTTPGCNSIIWFCSLTLHGKTKNINFSSTPKTVSKNKVGWYTLVMNPTVILHTDLFCAQSKTISTHITTFSKTIRVWRCLITAVTEQHTSD